MDATMNSAIPRLCVRSMKPWPPATAARPRGNELTPDDKEDLHEFLSDLDREFERHAAQMRSLVMRLRSLGCEVKPAPRLTPTPSPTGRTSRCVEIGRQRLNKGRQE